MKRVLTTPNAADAHVTVAALASAGIQAVIRGEYMGALPIGPSSSPSVWVRDEDYSDACQVLGLPEDPAQGPEASNAPSSRVLVIIVLALGLFVIVQRC